jgi:hypothetical protein
MHELNLRFPLSLAREMAKRISPGRFQNFSFPWPVQSSWPVESAAACEVRSYFTGLFQQAYFTGPPSLAREVPDP